MKLIFAGAAIALWFLYFARGGLLADLSGDDLMNMYGYLQKPLSELVLDVPRFWSTAYRPLGALLYVPVYGMFGMNPLPYRIACFAILGVNLFLLYRFCLRLTNSREIATIATFLASYHAWFVDLYYSAGTIYDLLCYTLYLSAFLVYIRIRGCGRTPGWRGLLAVAALYVLALDAKEMAVTLPLMMLFYELAVHTAGPRRWLTIGITGALTAVYAAGKLTGPDSLVRNPQYALTVSPARFVHTFHLYLNPLLYQDHWFRDANTARLLIGMLVPAALLRSRAMLFGWVWLVFTLLPVAFIAHYAEFFEYLPAVGWALYIATLLVTARRALMRRVPGPVWISQALLCAGLAAFLAPLNAREAPKALSHFMSVEPPTREITADLLRLRPKLRPGARVLFVDDPYPADSYFLLYEVRLTYRDMTAEIVRTRTQPVAPAEYSNYDAVFGFRGDHLVGL